MSSCSDCDELPALPAGPPGPRGAAGSNGSGSAGATGGNAYSTTTSAFIQPAVGSNVTLAVASSAWCAVGQAIYVESAGYYEVMALPSGTSITAKLLNVGTPAGSGTSLSSGRKVTPAGYAYVDEATSGDIENRITVLENLGTGNKTWYSNSAPSSGMLEGDIWFDTNDGYKMYRYDGSNWISIQRVLDLLDFGTGIRPIVKVSSLPTSGYSDGDFVWLTTDGKLYRRVSGAWTKAIATGDLVGQIDGTMIVDGTLVAQKLAANSVTADKVGTNEIIATSANIKDGVITSAKIASLEAGKITAGALTGVDIEHTGYLFRTVGLLKKYFRATEFQTSFGSSHSFGTGSAWGFTHAAPVVAYAPGNANFGASNTLKVNPDSSGTLRIALRGQLYGGLPLACTMYWRLNGGAYQPLTSIALGGSDFKMDFAFRTLSGLDASSKLEFFVAPCDGAGALATAVTTNFSLDVMAFNW